MDTGSSGRKVPLLSGEDWSRATWQGAREAALLEGARLTLAEKLEWLEKAAQAVSHLHGRARARLRGAAPRR